MRVRLFGPAGWCAAFVLVAALVFGGLAWVTVASLRVEAAQLEATARADRLNQERLALWRLDGYLLPPLGLENNRPFAHYTALHAPPLAWDAERDALAPNSVRLPSPLLSADLPPWMLLHFQIDPDRGWDSPQVIPPELADQLKAPPFSLTLKNVTPQRRQLLEELRAKLPAHQVLQTLAERERTSPDPDGPDGTLSVPAPLVDETAVPKPPGLSPGQPDPAESRPVTTERLPPPSAVGLEKRSPATSFAGAGRAGGTGPAVVLSAAAAKPPAPTGRPAGMPAGGGFGGFGGHAPGGYGQTGFGGFGGIQGGFGGGAMPLQPPAPAPVPTTPGAPVGNVLSQYAGNSAAQPPGPPAANTMRNQAQAPLKGEPQQEPAPGDYAARQRLAQQQARGGAYDHTTQPPQKSAPSATPPVAAATPPPPGPKAPGVQADKPPGFGMGGLMPRRSGPAAPAPLGRDANKADLVKKPEPNADAKPGFAHFRGVEAGKKLATGKDARFFRMWPFADEMRELKLPPVGGPASGATALRGDKDRAPPGLPPPPAEEPKPERAEGPPEAGRERAADAAAAPAARKAAPTVQPMAVHVGPLRPQWLTTADGAEVLVLVRAARLEQKTVYQGVLLDWPELRRGLTEQVADLFPDATLTPSRPAEAAAAPSRAMTTLPAQLDPGPAPDPPPAGWSPLRLGLLLAWAAALIALVAVGFGGRALVDLSERRIRFVSAVTHELRTPLTSLRLYLDLLTSGMIEDEEKRKEYLTTLAAESERLNRLIENVLDFARLEKRSVQAVVQPTNVVELLDQVRQTWADRCAADGKELVVISTLPPEQLVSTDPRMAAQVLGNLVDNARKYTRDAADQRIWVWARPGGRGRVVLEVEDRGPGVAPAERGGIFRPFRRGQAADTLAGGAGLGLALAKHWADLLGGTLSYRPADGGVGACFRLELPAG